VVTTMSMTAVMPSTRTPASTRKPPRSIQVMLASTRCMGSPMRQKVEKIHQDSAQATPMNVTPMKSPWRGSFLPKKKVST